MTKKLFLTTIAASILLCGSIAVKQAVSQTLTHPWWVVDRGGGRSTAGGLTLWASIGQPVVQKGSAAGFTLEGGFIPGLRNLAIAAPPPAVWNFTSKTNRTATIAVPAAINPSIGTEPLQTGDAIGVFFERNASLICAGFGIWQAEQNMAITAWGDDDQTSEKDGFAEGELIRYKIWDASAQREYDARVAYSTGGTTYATDGIYQLSSLTGVIIVSHTASLAQSWNMISSFVEPTDPQLDTLLAAIIPNLRIMKNGAGQVFWPELGINQIGKWNFREGYQVNMKSAANLTITGAQIAPEATPISLAQGWNLVAYLRNSPMNIETALASIVDRIVIVKNNKGEVYWPDLGINTIGSMMLGQGYQMNLKQATTLSYPANSAPTPSQILAKSQGDGRGTTPRHYSSSVSNTGANATLLIESPNLTDGDEVAVWTRNKMLVGRGVVRQGKALITVWGDNNLTKESVEGAAEGEALALEVWSAAEQKEKSLAITALTNGLTGEALDNTLAYKTDAVWVGSVAEAEQIPTSFTLSQNYPNPFNPSTLIKYGLPHDTQVKLEVYNVLGQRVAVLVDEKQKAGYHDVVFENSSLPSGVYFYRLQAGTFTQTMKMLMVR